jgi:hypothetical protein
MSLTDPGFLGPAFDSGHYVEPSARELLVHCFTYIGSAAGGNFGLRQGAKEEHIRYVTTERRGISPKVSRPEGLKRRS